MTDQERMTGWTTCECLSSIMRFLDKKAGMFADNHFPILDTSPWVDEKAGLITHIFLFEADQSY